MDEKKAKILVKRVRMLLVILICIWIMVVFFFSQQNGESSGGLSYKIAKFIFKNEEVAKSMEVYVRKLAHMFEYAVGGGLFCTLFMTYDLDFWKRNISVTTIVTVLAALDELHQHFVPGRNGVWYDVLIDVAGCILGVFIVHVIFSLIYVVDYLAVTDISKTPKKEEIDDPYRMK